MGRLLRIGQFVRQDLRGLGGKIGVGRDEFRGDFAAGHRLAVKFLHPARAFVQGDNDLVHGIRRLPGFAQVLPDPGADFTVERGALQALTVAVGINTAGNFQLQRRPGVKALRQ